MAFSSGTYTLPGPALNTGDTVSATENNTFRNDVATAFNLTWLRNGTAAATADMPMGGFSFTNCAAVGSNGSLLLKVNNGTTAATLDTSGNLLVGKTTNNDTSIGCVILSTDGNTGRFKATGDNSGSGAAFFITTTAGAAVYVVRPNGNVLNANNSYGSLSDIKLKENIVDASPKLAQLSQVRIVNYNLIGSEKKQIGVVAQELEQIFPGMVEESPDYEEVTTTDEEGNETIERVATGTTTKSVKYSVFVPILIKAIQEQQAIITQLQADIEALKGRP